MVANLIVFCLSSTYSYFAMFSYIKILLYMNLYDYLLGFPRWLSGKESACRCRSRRRHALDQIPGSERASGGRNGQPTLKSLPGKSHGQRSLAGNSPWGCKWVGHDLVLNNMITYYVILQWHTIDIIHNTVQGIRVYRVELVIIITLTSKNF